VWSVIVAAGSAERFGADKLWSLLGDRVVLEWSVRAAASVAEGVVVVASENRRSEVEALAGAWVATGQRVVVVGGGSTRAASVRAGLEKVPEEAAVVVVHDGARPLASVGLFQSVVRAVRSGAAASVPGLPLADTVKEVVDGQVASTPDRARLVAVQTPQAFAAPVLRQAHLGEPDATDDAGLVERLGLAVVVVPGEPENLKITRPADLVVAEVLLSLRASSSAAGAATPW